MAQAPHAVLMALSPDTTLPADRLAGQTGLPVARVNKALCTLILHGYAGRSDDGGYRLSDTGLALRQAGGTLPALPTPAPVKAPRRTQISLIWAAIRIRRAFTVQDIAALSGASLDSIRKYIQLLLKGHYLSKKLAQGRMVRYHLCTDPGPLTPRYGKCGLTNPNGAVQS